ncbi:MAG: hypothetical protein SOZ80_08585 [Prevotella sp.]|uniref:hypothetical protein n=1 Tax=Prevotella sp. TaxID=59823 RepID=UPI002A313960|nr:hypothetical protein [Prevotella sp.]MDD7317920.1 hypothetical protein [Prevotellaceae bacterium]MDY4020811.1 hypothetical protein [Prevotella sp.]
MALVTLFVYVLLTTKKYQKEVLVCGLIFLFYIVYSIYLGINIPKACFLDMLQQIKPYMAFYSAYSLFAVIKPSKYRKIRRYVLVFSVFLAILLIIRATTGFGSVLIVGHPTFAATCSFIFALIYLLFSDQRKKDVYIALIIMSFGLLSTRSKFYGDYIVFVFLFFFLKRKISFNVKFVVIFTVLISIMVYFAWEKLNFYYIEGIDNTNIIRSLLVRKTPEIMNDYFPFGTGFASFGNITSGTYFSPIYHQYGFDQIRAYGGFREGHVFFLGDTFIPNLAQYGYFGLFLLIWFWYRRWREIKRIKNFVVYRISIFVFFVIIIENLADTMYMSNRGMMLFILLGIILNPNSEYNKFMSYEGYEHGKCPNNGISNRK